MEKFRYLTEKSYFPRSFHHKKPAYTLLYIEEILPYMKKKKKKDKGKIVFFYA